MLAIAVTEGIAIAWWRNAMLGASLAELQRSWEFSAGVSNMEAIGFEITCDEDMIESDIAVEPIEIYESQGNGSAGDPADWTVTIFNSSFTLHCPDSPLDLNTTAMVMNLNYFQAARPACSDDDVRTPHHGFLRLLIQGRISRHPNRSNQSTRLRDFARHD